MQVAIDGQVLSLVADETVLINLKDEQVRVNTNIDKRYSIDVNDRLVVAPESRRLDVKYTLPEFMENEVYAAISALEADTLHRFADQEVALVAERHYTDTAMDSVLNQVYAELDAHYISNTSAGGRNYIFDLDFSQVKITTEVGAPELSLQELAGKVLMTEDAAAMYTQQVQMYNDNMAAFAMKIMEIDEELSAVVATAEVLIDAYTYIDVDGNYQAKPIAGLQIDASGVVTGITVNGSTDTVYDEVLIMADRFKIQGHTVDVPPFLVDTTTGGIKMSDQVSIDGSLITDGVIEAARLPIASSTEDGIITSADYEKLQLIDGTTDGGSADSYA